MKDTEKEKKKKAKANILIGAKNQLHVAENIQQIGFLTWDY